jgi:hypothetical protein
MLTSASAVEGFATYHFIASGQDVAVPLETRTTSHYAVPFDGTDGALTGIALSHIAGPESRVAYHIRDYNGIEIVSGQIALGPHAHTTFVLSDRFPDTMGARGTIEFVSETEVRINVVALRFLASGYVANIPVLAPTGPGG